MAAALKSAGAAGKLYERARTPGGLSAVTDAAGAYSFERLAPGEYLLAVEARGF